MTAIGRSRPGLAVRKAGKRWVWYRVKRKLQHQEYMFFAMGAHGPWHRMKTYNNAFHVWK